MITDGVEAPTSLTCISTHSCMSSKDVSCFVTYGSLLLNLYKILNVGINIYP